MREFRTIVAATLFAGTVGIALAHSDRLASHA
jgi:hypothetical protein